jgi:PQQ-dependent catabolism-associated CXXCW motif protein
MLAMMLALAATVAGDFDPVTQYRIAHYRGVIAQAPEGVRRIDARAAHTLWSGRRAVFIDLTPAEGGQRDAVTGRWTLAEQHRTIPRAHWFPEAGRGVQPPGIEAWFVHGIGRLASPRKTVVVFCLADCWMSWNAALRLHRLGYRDVRWFGDGLDGWRDIGAPTVAAQPYR